MTNHEADPMPTTPSDDEERVRLLPEAPAADPRVRAAATLSYARALVKLAEEELMERVPMVDAEFNDYANASNALDALADTVMAPHNIAQVLRTVEEIAGDAQLPHRHFTTLSTGQVHVTRAGREQILSAIVDARREAMEDETVGGEPEYDREPADHRRQREHEDMVREHLHGK